MPGPEAHCLQGSSGLTASRSSQLPASRTSTCSSSSCRLVAGNQSYQQCPTPAISCTGQTYCSEKSCPTGSTSLLNSLRQLQVHSPESWLPGNCFPSDRRGRTELASWAFLEHCHFERPGGLCLTAFWDRAHPFVLVLRPLELVASSQHVEEVGSQRVAVAPAFAVSSSTRKMSSWAYSHSHKCSRLSAANVS